MSLPVNESLSGQAQSRATGREWWWPPGHNLHGQRPVLFFPPSGAEPTIARGLIQHAAGLRFGVLQLPGRGRRSAEPSPIRLGDVIEATAEAVSTLDGPPAVLVGHSFGGLLAYGVAAELEARGCPVARLITVAAASPSFWRAELDTASDLAAFVGTRTQQVLTNGGAPAQLLAHRDFGARARHLTEVDVQLSAYGFEPRALHTPITAVVARDDTVLATSAADGWALVAAGEFRRIDVPGGHFFYRAAPERLVAHLRMDVQSLDGDYESTPFTRR